MSADFRSLCAEVLDYSEGRGKYNFSRLKDYDRDNAAFDAWQDIKDRLKSALDEGEADPIRKAQAAVDDLRVALNRACEMTKPLSPAAQPVPVSEQPWEREGWCDGHGRCWWTAGQSTLPSPAWWLVSIPQACTGGVMLPAHALPILTIPT